MYLASLLQVNFEAVLTYLDRNICVQHLTFSQKIPNTRLMHIHFTIYIKNFN